MLSRTPVCATLPYKGLKSAEAFYTKKLGLELASGSVDDGYLEFLAGEGTRIQLFESDSRKSEDTCATFDVDDLASEMNALRKKGVEFEEYDLPGVRTVEGVATMGEHRGAWIKDPGGNILGLHESVSASTEHRSNGRGSSVPKNGRSTNEPSRTNELTRGAGRNRSSRLEPLAKKGKRNSGKA